MSDPFSSSSSPATGPISQSVERLRREFERWVEAAMQQGNRALDVVGLRTADRMWTPAIDLMETAGEVLVDVDLPGVDASSVDVALAGNMLTIQGPKRTVSQPELAVSHQVERMHGPFQRAIPMPAPVVPESVSAEMKNGVLKVRLQKSEKARATKIPVQSEHASGQPHGHGQSHGHGHTN